MKNIVTFETAQRLKEAGFPQPNWSFGQYWYNKHSALFPFTNDIRNAAKTWFFAPTATDILAQITGHSLTFSIESGWHCFFISRNGVIYSDFQSDNPAEAAAAAWLQHKKVTG